ERDWLRHQAGVLASLAPAGYLERALAARAAALLWRLQRVARFERDAIAIHQEEADADLGGPLRRLRAPAAVAADLEDARAAQHLAGQLPRLPDDAPVAFPAADALLWAIADRARL